MTFLVLFSRIDEKSSITTNIDKMFPAVPDIDSGDDGIRHEHDVCHTKIIDGCQNPSSPFPWEDGAMGSVPRRPTADDRPREWLALPGGRIRPVVSVPGDDGVLELMAHAAWLARPKRPCGCGRPRLGSGRTCGSVECVARLRDDDAIGQPGAPT
jgi:hypothetical protein